MEEQQQSYGVFFGQWDLEDNSNASKRLDLEDNSNAGKRKLDTVSLVTASNPTLYEPNTRRRFKVPKKNIRFVKSETPHDDKYSWRKYGQKDILGATFPRAYFRCTYRHSQGCQAMKQVQQLDSNLYETAYKGIHSCSHTTNDTSQDLNIPACDNIWTSNYCSVSSNEMLQEESFISSISSANNKATESEIYPIELPSELDLDYYPSCAEKVNPFCQPRAAGSQTKLKLFEALLDIGSKMVCIYGHAGIGKTTAMKNVFSRCKKNPLLDLVLWITVTRCSTRRQIQNELLEQLPLTVPDLKTDDEVAMILLQHLGTRNFVLFLDDVTEIMDLVKVGIPLPCKEKERKIILSTRSMVVCQGMKVEKVIEAKALSKAEALELLRDHVGDVMDLHDINPYAQAIVEECSGFPLTIKVVGSALRMEFNVIAWKRFLKDALLTNNLRILKLGYDRLQEHEIKSCFLYFALLTKGKAMRLSCLVNHLIEEGFVEGSMSNAHKRAHDIIMHLVKASLLEISDDDDDDGLVNMNYVICNLALMIFLSDKEGLQLLLGRYFRSMWSPTALLLDISRPTFKVPESSEKAEFEPPEDHKFLLTTEGLNEPPLDKEWEESRIACLTDNTFSSLPKSPPCSKLVTLFLQRNSSLRVIPPSFFDNMSSLQILNLSKTRIKTLPLSLSKLESLQALVLRNCERLLFLPSVIGALKHLLVLDVQGTEIGQLPDEIVSLHSLTNLYVSFYAPVDEAEYAMLPSQLISKGKISSLSELRELSITVHPGDPRWTKDVSHVITEVSSLKLTNLSIHFPEIKHLEYFINESPSWAQKTLTRFNFAIGHDVKRIVSHVADDIEHEYHQQDRCLRFVNSDDVSDVVGQVLSEATAFYLDHHLGLHSLAQIIFDNVTKLKFIIVRDCPQLKEIINGNELKGSCFPFLEHMSIHYSWDLRKICVGPVQAGSFANLRRLLVHSCPRLEYVLSYSMVATLSSLEELVIEDCQSLKCVVDHDHSSTDDDIIIDSDFAKSRTIEEDINDSLENVPQGNAVLMVKVLKLHYLPKLENISNGAHFPRIQHLSLYNCPLLRNLHLKSINELTLKKIKTETDWWDALKWDDPDLRAKLKGHVEEINVGDIWGKL